MNNNEFLEIIKAAFKKCLETSPRSNQKLKILHGAIAADISKKLGDKYTVHSLGINDDKEVVIYGRYMDKKIDIAIKKENEVIAAVSLKFIMSNYSQNSNNYFENMLGETANIRSNNKPYFQILIIPSMVPYFEKGGNIRYYETITKNNLNKYIKLSNDNDDLYMHTPNKTLLYLVDVPIVNNHIEKEIYKKKYLDNDDYNITLNSTEYSFGSAIVYNDYKEFIDKICHYILSI